MIILLLNYWAEVKWIPKIPNQTATSTWFFISFDEEDLFGFNPCPLNRFLRTTACYLAIKWWVHLTRIILIHRL